MRNVNKIGGKILILLTLTLLTLSFANAEIIIHNQPNSIQNYGDTITINTTVKTLSDVTSNLIMNLICNGKELNFYKNGLILKAGQEKTIDSSLILAKSLIGDSTGNCLIKVSFGEDYLLSNEFKISDKIILNPNTNITEFKPGENVLVSGTAIKENSNPVKGFIELTIEQDNETSILTKKEQITNGNYNINITIPEKQKASVYILKLKAYEEEDGVGKVNTGYSSYNIRVSQVPTSLEVFVDEDEVTPGTNAKIRAVLHDQTGELITSNATLSVKNNESKLIIQEYKNTGEILEVPIAKDELPSIWTVEAESNNLNANTLFSIKEKKEIEMSIAENTLTIKNIGNIPYTDPVTLKIGEENKTLEVSLNVGESKDYKLTAPEGEYDVTVSGNEKEVKQRILLTGSVIGAKEKTGIKERVIFPFIWIFIIFVLGFVAYNMFNRSKKQTYVGYFPSAKAKPISRNKKEVLVLGGGTDALASNKAEVCLSIKGEKQKSTAVCVNIKNMISAKGSAKETIQRLVNFAESNKAVVYENQNFLFFILAPIKTKTFNNESDAFKIAQAAKNLLTKHNQLFNEKLEFGISINGGFAIVKPERDSTKFMGMGDFVTGAKKMALMSQGQIYLTSDIRDRLRSQIKVEKVGDNIYNIVETKSYSDADRKYVDDIAKKYGN